MDENRKNNEVLQLQILENGDLIIKLSRNKMQNSNTKSIIVSPLSTSIESKDIHVSDLKIESQEQKNAEVTVAKHKSKKVILRWEIRKIFIDCMQLDYEKIVGLLIKNQVYKILEDMYGADKIEEIIRRCLTQMTYDKELTHADKSPDTPWIRTKKLEEEFNNQGKRRRGMNGKTE